MADVKFSELTVLAAADVASADILAIVDTSASVSKKITIDSLFGAVPVNIAVEDTTNSTSTTTGSIQTDGGIGVAKSVVVGDDLSLKSDAAVLNFGADSDVSLTHYADQGLLVNSTRKIYFEDGVNYDQYIGSAGSGVTAVAAPTEIDLTASTIDINGAVDVSSTLSVTSGITGLSTLTLTGNILPAASGTVDIGSASAEFNDVYLADSSVLNFGSDQDTTLTHTDGSGLALNSTNKLGFGGAFTEAISSPSSGLLNIVAGTEVQIDTTTVDLNGALDVSGAITGGSTITMTGNILPSASGTVDIGSTGAEFNDVFLADASVVNFGDDQDVTLTHVADTGLLLNGASVIQFRDSALTVGSAADGRLDIGADTSIDMNSNTVTFTSSGADTTLNFDTDGYDVELTQADDVVVAKIFDGGAAQETGFTAYATGIGGFGFKRNVVMVDGTSAALTPTLTADQSGSIILCKAGTNNIDFTLPTGSTGYEGIFYEFVLFEANGAGTTITFTTAGNDGADTIHMYLNLGGATSATVSGDVMTIGNAAPLGTKIRLTLISAGASGTAEVWLAEAFQPNGSALVSVA